MKDLRNRLEKFIERIPESGCWIFTGSDINNIGYARFRVNGKRVLVHRLSYSLNKGDPGKLHVLHKCDIRLCINPAHLFLGTQADNMKDKANKKRCADRHGERHPLCQLRDHQIDEIRDLRKCGWKQKELAKKFNVTQSHISRILSKQVRYA